MNRCARRPRRAVIVICVLVCLLVASAMVTATTASVLRARREVTRRHQMRQTELLLDAGVLRAAQQIKASADYQGETWQVAGAIPKYAGAVVEIKVIEGAAEDGRQVRVTASLQVIADRQGQSVDRRTRRTYTFTIPTTPPSNSE